jgi:phosphatidylglycerophosphate synthase
MKEKLPTMLSLSRILLGAAVLALYDASDPTRYVIALLLTLLGLATDFLDGYLARRWNAVSEAGYIIDGLGDRAFYVALVLAFVAVHDLSLLLAWLLLFREILIYAIRVLHGDSWKATNRHIRKYSLAHALSMRLWILTFYGSDALSIFWNFNVTQTRYFLTMQNLLVGCTLTAAYISIGLMLADYLQRDQV